MPTHNSIIKLSLKKLWLGRHWGPADTFNVYIDSPFCVQDCCFCFLNPTRLGTTAASLHKIYYAALVEEIHDWEAVLRSHPVDTIYFGGGTSTLMTTQIMESIFASIPGFNDIGSKCFECDPASLTKAKIDLFAERDFSYITFGVQTLDTKELNKQHRVNPPVSKLKELTNYVLNKGIYVSYDLMAFLNEDINEDMERLNDDLNYILGVLKPTAVDIYPTSPNLEGNPHSAIGKVARLRSVLLRACKRHQDYSLADGRRLEGEEISFDSRYRNYFLINMDPNQYFDRIKTYSCSEPTSAPPTQNTLGFGGYGRREVYSYLDQKEICYRSRFDDVAKTFVYV